MPHGWGSLQDGGEKNRNREIVNGNADWKMGILKVFKGNLVLMFCHLLLHLIDLSDLAYTPHIVQLLVWLPAPRRVHKGHIFFCTLSFPDTCFTTGTPVCIWALASLHWKHRFHAQKAHILVLCCRIAWKQMKTAFACLDARISPYSSDMPWKEDRVVHIIGEFPLSQLAEISGSCSLELPDWMSLFPMSFALICL